MMGPGAARDAKGLMLVAGPEQWLTPVREALAAMTGEVWHVGERADLAAAYKLFGNAAALSVVGVVADIMRLADAAGVPRTGVLDMLAKVNLNAPVGGRGKMMVTGEFVSNFALDVARKDLRLMLETAGDQAVPLLAALAARMDEGLAAGKGREDFAVIGAPEAPVTS